MDNKLYRVQTVRKHLYNSNMLYIKGFYLSASEEQSIKIYADKMELNYSETKLSEDEEDESTNEEIDEIVSHIWVELPEMDSVKKLEIICQNQDNEKKIMTLSGSVLKMIMQNQVYNIDAMEKVGDRYAIKGWIIYKHSFELQLLDNNGEFIPSNIKTYERLDVEMAYPELIQTEKATGFRFEFCCENERDIQFKMLIDNQEIMSVLDTKSDFSGNKKLLAVLNKSLKVNGVVGTICIILKHFRHPVALIKRVSNKIGFTSVLLRFEKTLTGVLRMIEEVYLSKTKYATLMKTYPYAMRRLLCLKDMPQVKHDKNMHCSGDVKFSILVPLFNTPVEFLNEMIESVQMQTYENWELCLADGSDEKHSYVGEICLNYQKSDKRILYKKLDKNYGISGNTNECIKMATGNFIALFDHDDFLHPMVLKKCYEVIKNENADYVYTDEATFQVKLDNIGTYHFKPDYAPDNLRANNYICHFSTFSKELLDRVGWYDSKYDGSQDHDLILRLTENAKCVKHIQEILYFWRSHPGSVAEDINSKVYAIEAGKRAVLASLTRSGMTGCVESSKAFPTIYRIKYDLVDTPMVSIIIPSCNHVVDLKKCVESIQDKSTYKNYEIIIVKSGTEDDEISKCYECWSEVSNVKVLEWNKEFSCSAINNYAIKHAEGSYVLFLNEEIKIITPEWIEEMMMYAQRSDVAAVGAKLYYSDNTIRHAGIVLGMGEERVAGRSHYRCQRNELGYMGRLFYSQNVSAVSSACMLIKKETYVKLGGFDEEYEKKYYDVDLCVNAIKEGYLNVFTPYAEAYQSPTVSQTKRRKSKKNNFNTDALRFKSKWEGLLNKGDIYFNRNFSLDYSCFVIGKNELFRK